jgi:hypothetical protein
MDEEPTERATQARRAAPRQTVHNFDNPHDADKSDKSESAKSKTPLAER